MVFLFGIVIASSVLGLMPFLSFLSKISNFPKDEISAIPPCAKQEEISSKIKSMTKILNNYDGIDEIINKANEELKKEQKETIDTFDNKNYIEKMDKVIDKIKKLNIVPNSITKNINNVLAQKGKTSDKRKYLILKYYYKVFKQISQNIETNDLKDAYKHMNDDFSDSEASEGGSRYYRRAL